MKLSSAEIISGGVLITFAGWFLFKAYKLPAPLNPADVGSATFPKLIAWVILLLSLILISIGVKEWKHSSKSVKVKRRIPLLAAIITMILYAIIMPIIGYYMSTALYFLVMLLLTGERRWIPVTMITVGFLLFSKAGFELLLNVPLP